MPEGREWRLLIGGLLVADLLAYLGALLLAAWLVAQTWLGAHLSQGYWPLVVLALPVALVIFASQGLYEPQNLLGGTREWAAIVRSCTYGLLAIILLSFAVHYPVAREWTVLSWLLSAALMAAARFGIRRFALRLRRRGLFTTRTLLVGADAQGVAVARQLSSRHSGMRLVGVLDDYLPVGTTVAGRLRVLGASSRLRQAASRTRAREVIVVPQALPWESLQTLLAGAIGARDGLRIHLLGGFYDLLAAGVRISERNGVPLLTVKKVALTPFESVLKRVLDCGLAAALLVLLAPVGALQILLFRTGPSGVLERRPVLSRDGRPFELLSFHGGLAGRSALIRKLPSLLNVLAGQLSIVGPNPLPADSDENDDARSNPFALRPGLTGLWRETQDPAEQRLLDLYYVRSYSVWLDLQILFTRLKVRLGMRRESLAVREAVRLA